MGDVADRDPLWDADVAREWARARDALRRVNQDFAVYGAVERTNARRLESCRARLKYLGVAWGNLAGRPVQIDRLLRLEAV